MINLATLYAQGQGVEKDLQKAGVLYKQAAELGDTTAQTNLNLILEKYPELNQQIFTTSEGFYPGLFASTRNNFSASNNEDSNSYNASAPGNK